MKFFFVIQGEGRGHITQAISLQSMLQKAGHEVAGVAVGHAVGRGVSPLISNAFSCPIEGFESPHISYDSVRQSLHVGKTMQSIGRYHREYRQSIKELQNLYRTIKPDHLVNFYEPLGGLSRIGASDSIRQVTAIGHQYLLEHPLFEHPKAFSVQRVALTLNSFITSIGANRKLALSFDAMPEDSLRRIYPVPPLLRPEVRQAEPPFPAEDFFLVYVSEATLAEGLLRWQQEHPQVRLECFWHNPAVADGHMPQPNVTFHQLNAEKFLEKMKHCRGLVSTAGFESVCEAFYFSKPAHLMPMPNHYEQICNAADAVRAGVGITRTDFDLSDFLPFAANYNPAPSEAFRRWVASAETVFINHLTRS